MNRQLPYLSAALLLIIIFGTMYGLVQQAQRSEANYPQIQIAEDTATALNNGRSPQSLIGANVDMMGSLAPFTIIYSRTGQIIAGSGYLHGAVPAAPLGMLSAAQGQTYSAVTWQPQAGVRIAAVSVAAGHYYVLSGRSLTEVEKNETHSLQLVLLGGPISTARSGYHPFIHYPKKLIC